MSPLFPSCFTGLRTYIVRWAGRREQKENRKENRLPHPMSPSSAGPGGRCWASSTETKTKNAIERCVASSQLPQCCMDTTTTTTTSPTSEVVSRTPLIFSKIPNLTSISSVFALLLPFHPYSFHNVYHY